MTSQTLFASVLGAALLSFSPPEFASGAPPPEAKAQTKAKCSHPSFSFYPGSGLTRVRYGVIEFHFDVCSDEDARSWGTKVTRRTTNSTGDNVGFFLEDASIKLVRSGSVNDPHRGPTRFATWEAKIAYKTCVPYVAALCRASGAYTINFYGSASKGKAVVDYKIMGGPLDMPLFTTP